MSRATEHFHIHAAGHVLAAIDASIYTASVCRHAAWAASRLAAPLEIVHVLHRHRETPPVDLSGNLALDERESLLLELSALDEKRGTLAQQSGRLLLQQAHALAADAGVEARTRLRHGGLVDTLTELEADVRLFVLGKRGEHAGVAQADIAKGHLGGELERVVRSVHRPLLVASRDFHPIRHVLIAFDGSATTRKGVEMVAASPLFRGLDVHVVSVGADDDARNGLQWAQQALAGAGFQPQVVLVDGSPEAVIAGYVREHRIDVLVMGAYGHSRIRQWMVGSTTTAVLRSCPIPVLLLR